MPLKLSRKQLAALTGQTAEGAKPAQNRATKPAQARKQVEAHKSPPYVGKRYRVARGLAEFFTTPPPVGSICKVWYVGEEVVWLDCFQADSDAEIRINIGMETLRDYFEEGGTK